VGVRVLGVANDNRVDSLHRNADRVDVAGVERQPDAMNSRTPHVVVARDLTRIYGAQRAVNSINFTVNRGETFGLLGPNGAGKSTTMRMIACRTPLTSGELSVEGLNVRTQAREIRSIIGVVPQENNLDPDLNVRRNLTIYASYFRMPKRE